MAARLPRHPQDAPLSLALAIVASSDAPLLLLDGEMSLVAASASFYRVFELDPAIAPGQIFALGAGEWDIPQLRSLLTATLSGYAGVDAFEIDLDRKGRDTRHLVLNAQKLDYADADNVRLMLGVTDVTAERAQDKLKDDLLREKAVLLQELQHRVANSLQIIASVLLQSARRVKSDETRTHLYDAHQRVMSVATLQQQLAASTLEDVELRPYFTQLCKSLGASMIRDRNQISLDVVVDDSSVAADVSVSLGLVVTELVINALKHAFPGRRKGKIAVSYGSAGPKWTLSVADNGVGMPTNPDSSKPGLGTSIVEALAHQLNAKVLVASANPGTSVSLYA